MAANGLVLRMSFDTSELDRQLEETPRADLAVAYLCCGCDVSRMIETYELSRTGTELIFGVRLKTLSGA